MLDWRGKEVEEAKSRGGVIALANPLDNVIRPDGIPWPPPELVQKLYRSERVEDFSGADQKIVTRVLGFYSDLQSLNSEDAATWSMFGPIVYATPEARINFARALLAQIEVPTSSISMANVWLWRRLPHPEKPVSGGPEIDFGLQTDDVFVIGEAKWHARVGVGQGIHGDKNQIEIRREFCKRYGRQLIPTCRRFVVLGLTLKDGSYRIVEASDKEAEGAMLHERETTWEAVAALDAHPMAAEVREYLSWKKRHSSKADPRTTK